MIPQAAITHWRNNAPWPQDAQVEQDLILSRALAEIFGDKFLAKSLLLRGGTALHKLAMKKPLRYSEDIDLVQVRAGPIGPVLDAIRSKLDPFLGVPQRGRSADTATLRYRMDSEIPPVTPLRLKIEINTREHFHVCPPVVRRFRVRSPWFDGLAEVRTYDLDELLATKMRALYQRRKGRDLFDLWVGLRTKGVIPGRIVAGFRRYMEHGGYRVNRSAIAQNVADKLESRDFLGDIGPLLATGLRYKASTAVKLVNQRLISIL
jgi:predicted nucleotidyltransferase component of viral defense system